MNSDKSATRSGLVGRYLTVLDLKTSCRTLSASVRWTKTICRGSRVPQPTRNCHESHENKASFPTRRRLKLKRVKSRQNRLVCGKLMSRQILTLFQSRQKICSSRTKNQLVGAAASNAHASNESYNGSSLNGCKRTALRTDHLHKIPFELLYKLGTCLFP